VRVFCKKLTFVLFWVFFVVFVVGLAFELRASQCKAGTLQFEPHLQSILLSVFWILWSLELFAWA
jgi:hypothetical protein